MILNLVSARDSLERTWQLLAPNAALRIHRFARWSTAVEHLGATETPEHWFIDLDFFREGSVPIAVAIAKLNAASSKHSVTLLAPRIQVAHQSQIAWATELGAHQLSPWPDLRHWSATIAPSLALISPGLDAEHLYRRMLPLIANLEKPTVGVLSEVESFLSAAGTSLTHLCHQLLDPLRSNLRLEVIDRRYHLKTYPECFLASDLIGLLCRRFQCARDFAVKIGFAMQQIGAIYHVAFEQDFADQHLFFRLSRFPTSTSLRHIELGLLAQGRVPSIDREYHGKTYRHCFVGSEFVSVARSLGFSLNEAISTGGALWGLSTFSHVVDEHAFRDGNFFYRYHAA